MELHNSLFIINTEQFWVLIQLVLVCSQMEMSNMRSWMFLVSPATGVECLWLCVVLIEGFACLQKALWVLLDLLLFTVFCEHLAKSYCDYNGTDLFTAR